MRSPSCSPIRTARSPGRTSVSGPRSIVTLSMLTVPTSGWRLPRTRTSQSFERARLAGVLRPQAPHAAVELDVHARRAVDRVEELARPGHNVRVRVERDAEVVSRERAHHEDALVLESGRAQRLSLARGGNGEPRGAAGERRARSRCVAVSVAVGLHHCAELRAI